MKTLSLLSLSALALAAPLVTPSAKDAIKDRYLVVLKKDQTIKTSSILKDHFDAGALTSGSIGHTYALPGFNGFAATLNTQQLQNLKGDNRVLYLEADGLAHTQIEQSVVTESSSPWGLGRISHRAKGSTDYLYDTTGGAGTCAYIIDTGVTPGLDELEGRATMVKSFVAGATQDDNGHGTHVSGTIGSKTYGVAKKTNIYGIKVLDSEGSGAWSDIIAGIQLAVTDSATRACAKGVVVNMSLGGSTSQAVNDAAAAASDAGLFLAVAAGNEAADYHTSSPASEPKVFAVGASDVNDTLASFSNYGKALGVIAPGVDVLSIWMDGTTQTLSGTSMATPHVAGLAAYVLSLSATKLTVAQLKTKLQSLATTKAVQLGLSISLSTPNLLAFNGATA